MFKEKSIKDQFIEEVYYTLNGDYGYSLKNEELPKEYIKVIEPWIKRAEKYNHIENDEVEDASDAIVKFNRK